MGRDPGVDNDARHGVVLFKLFIIGLERGDGATEVGDAVCWCVGASGSNNGSFALPEPRRLIFANKSGRPSRKNECR